MRTIADIAARAASWRIQPDAQPHRRTRPARTLPTVRVALQLLAAAGFEHVRTKGSHALYRRADGVSVGLTINHPAKPIDRRALVQLKRVGILGGAL